MRSGNEGRGDGLADQILRFINAAAVSHHQRFGSVDLGGDNKSDYRQIARSGGCERAGAQVANLHVPGGDGGDHFRATVKPAPIYLLADNCLISAICLRYFARVDTGLVADREVRRLSTTRN